MSLATIRAVLGSPYYEADNFILYNTDCLTAMSEIPDNLLDLTVTSPPYNIGKEYEEIAQLSDYLNWCQKWVGEIYRITRVQGAFWLNLGYITIPDRAKAIPISYLLWDRIPFFLIQEIVWNYGAGVAGKKFLSPRNEKFLWYVKDKDAYTFNLDDIRDPNVKYPNQKKNGKIKVNSLGKNPTDVWEFPKVTSGMNRASKERTPHPAQFPLAVIDRIIKACSNVGEVLVDPFMGSGTTALAALSLDRKVVGFEIRRDYCDIIANRINSYLREKDANTAQVSLFSEDIW
jgi:adenine-specific DNA-methyltransferase